MRPDGSFPPLQQQHSWHSPVPYLFGGLAAMLGLIAFALLVLACSYWNLSGYIDDNGLQREQDPEGDNKPLESIKVRPRELDEKIVVIMAGDRKPTFIATPTSSKNSSFNGREEQEVKTPVADSSGEKPGDEHRQELYGGEDDWKGKFAEEVREIHHLEERS